MQWYINNYDCFYLFAKFYVIMCLTRIQKRWCTARFLKSMVSSEPAGIYSIFVLKITITLLGHWSGRHPKTCDVLKFCKEAKTIIVVDIKSITLFLMSVRYLQAVLQDLSPGAGQHSKSGDAHEHPPLWHLLAVQHTLVNRGAG